MDVETSDSEELLKKDEINPIQTLLFTVWARMQNLVTNGKGLSLCVYLYLVNI